jgi:4-aminobutyrate aminotransferase-like enzyme
MVFPPNGFLAPASFDRGPSMTAPKDWRSFPDAPRIRIAPPGPESKKLLDAQSLLETEAVVYSKYFPIGVAEARNATIEDVDGNRFIDWVSGVSVLNLGHRHPRLVAALAQQAERVWHSPELPTPARIDFLEQFQGILPEGMRRRSKILFTVTGADSVETAVSLADYVKGRRGTVAFSGAYHGVHGGAANLTSGRKYRATSSFRGASVIRVPYPDPYRPLLDDSGGSQGTIRYLEHLFNDPYSGADEASSVLVEPILGEGGYVVPPDDFLPALREFCDRHDLLLILDEIQTGFGRTGKMWACEHPKVTPDILCAAKTVGGGIPLSLVAYRSDLGKPLPPGFHLGTYRGNPLALAVGAETIRVLRDESLVERVAHRGPKLLQSFRSIAEGSPSVGEVRGRGFMVGIEYVSDLAKKSPWGERAKAMRHEMFGRGVMMHTCGPYDQVQRFIGPLTTEDELLERGLEVFRESLRSLERVVTPVRHAPKAVPLPSAVPRAVKTPGRYPARWRPAGPAPPPRRVRRASR